MKHNINRSIGRYISIIFRSTRVYLDRELRKYNIRAGQVPILRILDMKDGIRQEDICRFFKTDRSTTTKTIKPLIKNRYIVRKTDEEDRRAYNIHLTKKGRELIPALNKILTKWTSIITEGLSEDEKTQLLNLLETLSQNANKNFEEAMKGEAAHE